MLQSTKDTIKSVLKSAIINEELTGATMLLIHKNKEIFYHEDGYRDRERQEPIQRDTIHRLYSMTKPITAAAALLLMERGLIDLYDPVSRYLDGFKKQKVWENNHLVSVNREMTINDLLNMTSGLVYGGENPPGKGTWDVLTKVCQKMDKDESFTTVMAANELGKVPLSFQPGESWDYGMSADVLGAVISVVSGMSFGEFLRKELFEPLGMKDTDFHVPEDKEERLSTVYKGDNLAIRTRLYKNAVVESGGAGLVGSLDDYSKFAAMLLNKGEYMGKRILKSSTVEFMTRSCLLDRQQRKFEKWHTLAGHSYGNFLRIVTEPQKAGMLTRLGEYGWDGWLGCYFANFPKDQITFVLMMQKVDAGTTSLTRKLRNIILSDGFM